MELALNPRSLGEQLSVIHRRIRKEFPRIERVGVALYDAKSDVLKTFVRGADEPSPLLRFDIRLSDTPSLLALAESREAGIVDDLPFLARSSSFTRPFFSSGRLAGFLFFTSDAPGGFEALVVDRLVVFAELLSVVLLSGLEPVHLLRSAVRLAAELTRFRDAETGIHLARVASYARLIAVSMSHESAIDHEFIEFLGLYAPAHDIGKVAIPDHILFKQGVLSAEEYEIMKTHVTAGVTLMEGLIRDLDLDGFNRISMLRNIVRSHHELLDGSGYPDRLPGAGIPLEARIVAVADVFDALTSERPYKKTWSTEEALGYLVDRAGTQFDASCVAVFERHAPEIAAIRARFADGTGDKA